MRPGGRRGPKWRSPGTWLAEQRRGRIVSAWVRAARFGGGPLLPPDDGGRAEALERAGSSSGLDMAYYSTSALRAATVFLYRPWLGAEVGIEGESVQIEREGRVILAPLAKVTQQ
jgi:hypothetical protein